MGLLLRRVGFQVSAWIVSLFGPLYLRGEPTYIPSDHGGGL